MSDGWTSLDLEKAKLQSWTQETVHQNYDRLQVDSGRVFHVCADYFEVKLCLPMLRAVPEIILGGEDTFFVLWGEGVLLTVCPRGGGGE